MKTVTLKKVLGTQIPINCYDDYCWGLVSLFFSRQILRDVRFQHDNVFLACASNFPSLNKLSIFFGEEKFQFFFPLISFGRKMINVRRRVIENVRTKNRPVNIVFLFIFIFVLVLYKCHALIQY